MTRLQSQATEFRFSARSQGMPPPLPQYSSSSSSSYSSYSYSSYSYSPPPPPPPPHFFFRFNPQGSGILSTQPTEGFHKIDLAWSSNVGKSPRPPPPPPHRPCVSCAGNVHVSTKKGKETDARPFALCPFAFCCVGSVSDHRRWRRPSRNMAGAPFPSTIRHCLCCGQVCFSTS